MKPHIALSRHTRLQLKALVKLVAKRYGFLVRDLLGSDKGSRCAYARHFAMTLCRDCTDCSMSEIASYFGKDHTIIVAAERKIRGFCDIYPDEAKAYRAMLVQVKKEGLDESRWPGPPISAIHKGIPAKKAHE